MTFYNNVGDSVAYSEDDIHIYLFDGTPVAYIDGDSIYAYSGIHLGGFLNGWIRDHGGNCMFFNEESTGGPSKPFKKFKPFKGFKEFKPFKPFATLTWSDHSSEDFFKQQ